MDIGEHDLRLRLRLDWNCESSSPSPSLFRLNKFKSRLVYDAYELFETHDTVLSILSRSSLAASRFGDNLLGQCRAWQSDRGKMERVKSVPARKTCQEAALQSTTVDYGSLPGYLEYLVQPPWPWIAFAVSCSKPEFREAGSRLVSWFMRYALLVIGNWNC